MSDAELKRLIEHHAAMLAEHFDSVQIIASVHEQGKTRRINSGNGNYFARLGSVQEWLVAQDEQSREEIRPNEITLKEKPDDGDEWKQYAAEGV